MTVGTAVQGQLDLTNELNLLKAALLYADKVSLCSLASSLIVSLLPLGYLDEDTELELAIETIKARGEDITEFVGAVELYKSLRSKKRRTKDELLVVLQIKKALEQCQQELKSKTEEIAQKAGADGLLTALNTDLVELQLFDVNDDNLVYNFFDSISDALLSGETYPIFDDSTGQLVNTAINAGLLKPPSVSVSKARQVGLSSDLFNRLPLFDIASVDEIIDIRRELGKPLVHFRSAIIRFAKEIESAAWNTDFPQEVDQLVLEYIEPAVLELEDACKSNGLLTELASQFATRPLALPSSSFLGMLVSQASQLPDVVAQATTLSAGTAAVTYQAVREWRTKKSEIEKNQLYFYYRVGQAINRQSQ